MPLVSWPSSSLKGAALLRIFPVVAVPSGSPALLQTAAARRGSKDAADVPACWRPLCRHCYDEHLPERDHRDAMQGTKVPDDQHQSPKDRVDLGGWTLHQSRR